MGSDPSDGVLEWGWEAHCPSPRAPIITCESAVQNTTVLCSTLSQLFPSQTEFICPVLKKLFYFLQSPALIVFLALESLHHCVFFRIHKTLLKYGFP